jgi:Spy/CpxP family protein refolding chaperone
MTEPMKVFPRTPQEHFEHQGKLIDTAGRQPDVVDKDTLQQLEDLLKSPDIDKKKLSKELDAQVSDFLSRHQSKLEDIRKIFEANETKFTPEQKQQLEKLLKLAKVDESLKDEQRELSLAIDLTKENL